MTAFTYGLFLLISQALLWAGINSGLNVIDAGERPRTTRRYVTRRGLPLLALTALGAAALVLSIAVPIFYFQDVYLAHHPNRPEAWATPGLSRESLHIFLPIAVIALLGWIGFKSGGAVGDRFAARINRRGRATRR